MVKAILHQRKVATVRRAGARDGAALLFTLFIVAFITLMAINVLDTTTLEMSALRNTIDYERALFLANAGVHEAAAQLETDSSWTGTITDGSYPADDTYQAVVASAGTNKVTVTSIGVAGEITRTLQATIEL
jgi:Tfp pilus assembly protein PilX